MRSRCYNEGDIGFHNYGGRGISVCDQWRHDYDKFFEDMGECPNGLTLDRIDSDGNYEPGNCRWASYQEQMNNRPRFNRVIKYQGRQQTLAEWARELEVSLETLMDRLKRLPIDRAMTKGLLVNWAPGKHGTISTYQAKKCRCDDCVTAMRKYKRDAYNRKVGKLEYSL